MTERRHIYWMMKTDPHLRLVSEHHRQAHCYVAAKTQKEACEILDVRPDDMRNYGGISHNDPITKIVGAEPGVVFVEREPGLLSRWDELADPDKAITIPRDVELYGEEIEHASFGMITVTRFSGDSDLFMVDYPQGGAIGLEITTATLNRRGGHDRVSENKHIIRVEMSEVQWARMLSSFNTGGVPCTLRRYREPVTGDWMTPREMPRHKADEETFRKVITRHATTASESLTQARQALSEILKGPLRKGDLNEVLDALTKAEREFTQNLPYVAEQAHEAITTMGENTKNEIDAHLDNAMQRLGERALGARLQEALDQGLDPKMIGQNVILALNPPKDPVD